MHELGNEDSSSSVSGGETGLEWDFKTLGLKINDVLSDENDAGSLSQTSGELPDGPSTRGAKHVPSSYLP